MLTNAVEGAWNELKDPVGWGFASLWGHITRTARDWATATLDDGLGGERQGERPHLEFTATLTELATGTGTAVLTAPAYPTTSPRPRSPPPAGSTATPTCAWS